MLLILFVHMPIFLSFPNYIMYFYLYLSGTTASPATMISANNAAGNLKGLNINFTKFDHKLFFDHGKGI